jgi:hypothetical protein
MRIARRCRAVVAIALMTAACAAAPANVEGPLHGVWQLVEIQETGEDGRPLTYPAQSGQVIFTGSHYSIVFVSGPAAREPAATRWQPTPDEKLAAFDSIIVNSGTYEVSGSRLTVRPVIAKVPEFAGGRQTFEYTIEGDTLTLDVIEVESHDGVRLTVNDRLTLRRVE